MKPIKFKHQNITFAENQLEYMPLPALKIDSQNGEVVSCWKMTFIERVKVLITGKVWVSLLTFNKPLTPSYLAVNRKEVYSIIGEKSLVEKTKGLFKSISFPNIICLKLR